jgi:23S rRNA (cytidine1920-2'-O)/16S rRNA (cytidine1409-2'-O)-methyltransferase
MAAFETFDLQVRDRVCADVGASTGGFTDCLLQHGAAQVYAIDVGHGILHWKLRKHPRVIVMEGTNARYVERLPEPVAFVTVDASFISLKILLPVIQNWFTSQIVEEDGEPGGEAQQLIVLIKPQFEAGRRVVARGKGVVRDPEIHRQVLADVLAFTVQAGYQLLGLSRSPVLGPKGNVEFLAWLGYGGEPLQPAETLEERIEAVVESIDEQL